ncbi:MAG: ADP-glyceromanno-heptose 6-epimerase [Alphaproteobacteria bacterium]|nr:ADP-glyceromanno-heptose 6-epimerase [Alphaproteobacteria bacterium]
MILVTGGAGFIGSNIAAALEQRGQRVAVCDWLGWEDKWRNIAKRDLEEVVAPEQIVDFLDRCEDEIEAIVHMGAISSTTEVDADLIVESNLRLSQFLWRWCAEQEVPFIYASSAATYGDGINGFKDFEGRKDLAALNPLNAYGWSKHLFDRWVAHQKESGAVQPPQCAGLKFFNVYGPNEYHKGGQRSVVEQVYPYAARDEAFQLFKSHNPDYQDGGQLRDFIWVGDCVKVILWLLDNQKVSGLFNVGTGKARSFDDLAKAVYTAAGKQPKIEYRDMPEELRGKYQYYTQADMSKLRAAGYAESFTELEEGVRRYVQNYLMQPDKYL